jgi:hypothetical protein
MALSLFAAQAVLGSYLDGRTLPQWLHGYVVQSVEKRLIDGKLPVLDAEIRNMIDCAAATAPLASRHEGQRTTV